MSEFKQRNGYANLPEEILIDIFSRLPAKSVGRCRCLAKQWRTLLSTPQFIKSHLTQKPNEENLILVSPSDSIHSIADVKADAVSRRLEFQDSFVEVVGCCDGLVLLVNQEEEMCLVNPVTLQQVKIPDSPMALKKGESYSMHGFGYDRTNDDYKIVTLSYYGDYEPDIEDTFVDVYSAKRGVWKRVDCSPHNSPYNHAVPDLASGAYVNGAIHWLAIRWDKPRYPAVIVAFNFADEVFDEIPAPRGVDVEFVFHKILLAIGGCLCMMDATNNIVWILKDYGVTESWTKFRIDADHWFMVKPLYFLGNDLTVFVTKRETLVVYNVKDGSMRDMVVDGVPASFVDGCTFVESLVSPDLSNS